jgi:hypothetical protein
MGIKLRLNGDCPHIVSRIGIGVCQSKNLAIFSRHTTLVSDYNCFTCLPNQGFMITVIEQNPTLPDILKKLRPSISFSWLMIPGDRNR